MKDRFLVPAGLAAMLGVLLLQSGLLAQGRGAAPRPASAPRTPDGRPDLQGNWSFATVTPFERPANLADKTTLSDQEVLEIEQRAAAQSNQDAGRQRGSAADVSRAYNDAWYDRGTRVVGTRQTSIVVDPRTAESPRRRQRRRRARRREPLHGAREDRRTVLKIDPLAERCLIGFNAGPPFTSSAYNNNIKLVQTPDYVVITMEMVHDARIVPLDGRPHLPSSVRPWMGDSRGRWEGDTLVVETTNFNPKNLYRGASENLQLVERFTRSDADTLLYEFTLNDPSTWVSKWTGRMPLERLDGEVYEYACHEANYGMEGILKGTRAEERETK